MAIHIDIGSGGTDLSLTGLGFGVAPFGGRFDGDGHDGVA
jgi:hypothetical protein